MSLVTLTLAIAFLCQDPAPLPAGTDGGRDIIVLQSGEELRGTLLVEGPAYLEMRVGSDTTVGIERATVREIRRASPSDVVRAQPAEAAPDPEPQAASMFAGRDDWFVLHDGEGRCVGTLHSILRHEGDEIRLADEWDFVTERGRTQVTQLETLRRDGAPATCFYHERTQHAGERDPRDERLVRGTVSGTTLRVVRTTLRGSEQTEYTVGAGLALPLALREVLRQRPGQVGSTGTRMVFDAGRDELAQRTFATGERRRVEIDGRVTDVRETRIRAPGGTAVEWIDGTCRAVRIEVAGPALVAVRTPKDVALAMVANKAKAFPTAVLREAGGRFSWWLPNPIWRFDAEQAPGQVTAHAPLYDASVSGLVLDQVGPTAHLGMAGDAVERWLRVACRDFKLRARQEVEVRAAAALAIDGSYRRSIGDRGVRCDVTVLVVQTQGGGFLALCLMAPANDADALRPDFDRMVESLEVHAAAVAAEARPGKPKLTAN